MASEKVSYGMIAAKYGIYTGLAHVVYFLLMRVLDLQNRVELSLLSGLLLVIGIVVAISSYKRMLHGMIPYLKGIAIGGTVGVVSSIILALFLVLYLTVIDPEYLRSMQVSSLFPESISVMAVFALTIVYGSIPGILIGFIAMQWFKRPDHTTPERIR
jgi:energy-converting hydrogenase Eha subunit A